MFAFPYDDNVREFRLHTCIDFPLPKPDTFVRKEAKVGRNEPCPCGSGKKYKKCCFGKIVEDCDEA